MKKSIFIFICFIIISIFILKDEISNPVDKKLYSENSTIVFGDNLVLPTRFVFMDANKVDEKDNPLKVSFEDKATLSVDIIDSQDLETIKNFYINKSLSLLSESEFNKIYNQFNENKNHDLRYTLYALNTNDEVVELSNSHYFFSDGYIKNSGEFYQIFVKGTGANTKYYYVKGNLTENEIQYINQAYSEAYSLSK